MLEKLKEYKELIAIVVFFLGGFFWLENEFPKKKDITVLDCQLKKWMELTQLQMKSHDLEIKVQELESVINAYPDVPGSKQATLPPAVQKVLDSKKADLSGSKVDFKENKARIEAITLELQRNSCGTI